jgi:hypothetical protein
MSYVHQAWKEREAMSAHTPGPWRVNAYDARLTVWGKHRVAVVDKEPDGDTSAANAALIAAAPDLLAALKQYLIAKPQCECGINNSGCEMAKAQQVARAAIAKAEGDA